MYVIIEQKILDAPCITTHSIQIELGIINRLIMFYLFTHVGIAWYYIF